ncbi:MAG: DUF4261 domain-containing protein [Candidatus Parabeggiatoa sp.]|nr:DUF4261 domain-containing protein [Candidatus Parabeggiatoa sp.]
MNGFARVYAVELLFERQTHIDVDAILVAMQKYCGNVSLYRSENAFVFSFTDHLLSYEEGKLPAQCLLIYANPKTDKDKNDYLQSAIQQSWCLNNAQEIVNQSHYQVLFSDFMSSGLPYQERHKLFLNGLRAVLENVNCQGIYWQLSQQIIKPDEFLAAQKREFYDFLYGSINVRFFNIRGGNNIMLMDTLGLAALGLTDIQCHFTALDQNLVSKILFNLAYYVYENGEIIENGDTVPGIAPNEKWICQYEDALVEPKRVVIDLNPGLPYAAGNR